MVIKEMPIQERPRERLFAHGPDMLSDTELIAIVLGSGTRGRPVSELAIRVLEALDAGVRDPQRLTLIAGLGFAKASAIAAALEFSRRMLCPGRHRIAKPEDILPVIGHFADRKQEHFLSVSLNGAHEVIACRVVSVGLVNRTLVHPREVFADAVTDRATAVIVAHNHPSGRVEPSREDRDVTARLRTAGEHLGITLLDHVVFGDGGYYSFLEHGEI